MTKQSSRFLKHNTEEDSWHIIPVPHIRDKIGEFLTANLRSRKRLAVFLDFTINDGGFVLYSTSEQSYILL
jgi:hypothetical protein